MEAFGLTAYDSDTLLRDPNVAKYFEEVIKHTSYYKIVANIFITDIMRRSNGSFPVTPENIAKLADLFGNQIINSSTLKKLTARLWKEDFDPTVIVEKEGLAQINDKEVLASMADDVIKNNSQFVLDYKNGNEKVFEALVGIAMRKTNGKANPVVLAEILKEKLRS